MFPKVKITKNFRLRRAPHEPKLLYCYQSKYIEHAVAPTKTITHAQLTPRKSPTCMASERNNRYKIALVEILSENRAPDQCILFNYLSSIPAPIKYIILFISYFTVLEFSNVIIWSKRGTFFWIALIKKRRKKR